MLTKFEMDIKSNEKELWAEAEDIEKYDKKDSLKED